MYGRSRRQAMVIVSPGIQLPRTLDRPSIAEVSRDTIMAVTPELANVSPEYIRRGLRPKMHQMLAGISALSSSHLPTSMIKSHVPQIMSVPIRASPSFTQPTYPTHVLAVSSSKSSTNENMFLFPVHDTVIAAHCSSIWWLPLSAPPSPGTLHMPVLLVSLPSPAAFKILHSYLYNHSLEGVIKSLFPLPSRFTHGLSHHTVQSTLASSLLLHQLSSYLCSSSGSNLQVLTSHAAHVKELWQDMVALGLHAPELWDMVDLAWEVVLGALSLVTHNH